MSKLIRMSRVKKETRKMDLLLDQLCWIKVTTIGWCRICEEHYIIE